MIPEHTPDPAHVTDDAPEQISISHFVHTMKAYSRVIAISLLAIGLACAIVSILVYLRSPAQRMTTQRFSLDFEGASEGRYPNGARLGIADLISGPILQRVHSANRLGELMPFSEFAGSVFVLESNAAAEALDREFQARLADPKLTPVDRERIANEYELKRKSISKNQYSINFVRPARVQNIPEPIAQKVLLDILNGWADLAVNQRQVLSYRVSVLSPAILKPNAIEAADPIAAIEVLRGKATRVIANIKDLEELPGGNLVRSPTDNLSLPEVRLRLEEIIRFRLEPLVTRVKTSGLITDAAATTAFIETQLAYDRRQLQAHQAEAETIRQAIAVYEQRTEAESGPARSTVATGTQPAGGSETVMPQLNDTFLDRLMSLTNRAADIEYRQRLVDQYRNAVAATIPAQQAVAYDEELLSQLRSATAASGKLDATAMRAQVEEARTEVAQLIEKSNELYRLISRNMTPSTQLFTLTSTPTSTKIRSVDLKRLALYSLVVFLLAIPLTIAGCLLHNRVREEDEEEAYTRSGTAVAD